MARYLIDTWGDRHGPYKYMKLCANAFQHAFGDVLDWMIAMEINHYYEVSPGAPYVEPQEGRWYFHLVVPSENDAFAVRMAWNILPTKPKEDGTEEPLDVGRLRLRVIG